MSIEPGIDRPLVVGRTFYVEQVPRSGKDGQLGPGHGLGDAAGFLRRNDRVLVPGHRDVDEARDLVARLREKV